MFTLYKLESYMQATVLIMEGRNNRTASQNCVAFVSRGYGFERVTQLSPSKRGGGGWSRSRSRSRVRILEPKAPVTAGVGLFINILGWTRTSSEAATNFSYILTSFPT